MKEDIRKETKKFCLIYYKTQSMNSLETITSKEDASKVIT